ncbi:MAG: helix-turn-helix transcriptional regulator [Elusimicrobia bacterium]|nr:helix-turn-helix transcriptional regulator [Elusimicrobiota bacterium]
MDVFKNARLSLKLSQRRLAKLSGVSFRSVQLIESGNHNWRVLTLERMAEALGYPPRSIINRIQSLFSQPPESAAVIAEAIKHEGEKSWKIRLFNFVDFLRRTKSRACAETPPAEGTPEKIRALLASTTEALCAEMNMDAPWWCASAPGLREPWFVSEMENLKAMALLESPVFFRKRNIFVLKNFLTRA